MRYGNGWTQNPSYVSAFSQALAEHSAQVLI
jgi:hypothetical protein